MARFPRRLNGLDTCSPRTSEFFGKVGLLGKAHYLTGVLGWASVVGPDEELDLRILGDAAAEDERAWRWVCPTPGSVLLLSTHPLAEERHFLKQCSSRARSDASGVLARRIRSYNDPSS